jgi:methionyl-tRNA formyltransferase
LLYPYAQGDLLESRNTYFYTPFQGRPFLKAWETQRDGILSTHWESEPMFDSPLTDPATATDVLLDSIHAAIVADPSAGDWPDLDHLLQRFEVTKRVHGAYNDLWRACDPADYTSLPRYLRLAEVLELAYKASGALPYLNGLLKCMDTLTALHARLHLTAKERLNELIAKERQAVLALSQRLLGDAHGS